MSSFSGANVRYPMIALLAAAITYSLFLLMYYLTARPDGDALLSVSPTLQLDFIRLKPKEEELDLNRRQPPEKPVLKKQPEVPPPLRENVELSGTVQGPQQILPLNALDIRGGFSADLFGTRAPSPLVRVQPVYPARAQRRGIEGWVEVEFTIAEDGNVVDTRVVDSSPAGVFDGATLKAVKRWRYQPQIIAGSPIRRSGVRVVVEFKLEN